MHLTNGARRNVMPMWIAGRVRLLLAALALVSATVSAAATEVRQVVVNGEPRSYRLFLPPNLSATPVPVVIALHGAVQTAAEFETDLGLNRIAQRNRFAVVYPEGLNRVWDDARPPIMRLGYMVRPGDDVPFLTTVVRRLIAEGIADPNRIYLAGLSMGGFMATRMACEHAQLFAAVAVIAATVPEQYRKSCAPRRPLPALFMHGTFDPIVPWFGLPMAGAGILSANDAAQFFADLAGCMVYADSERPSLDRSAKVEIRRWSICRNNLSVMLYTIPGGGHLPPSAETGRGDTFVSWFLQERSHAIDAAEEIWTFFRRYRGGSAQHGANAQ
ncbi:MAG: PHB depolymerase family esterase [Xanthobacteraceae bacterium]